MKNWHRRRAGFIFLIGWRTVTTAERTPEVRGRCPHCGTDEARLIGRLRRTWFTLFFIPVFPLDPKSRAQRVSQCRECRQIFPVPVEQLARGGTTRRGSGFSDAIAVYNELRENPNDGQRMLTLLSIYQGMQELGEAESAARHYPGAMAAEPACAAMLEKMRRDAASREEVAPSGGAKTP